MSSIEELKERVMTAEAALEHATSLLNSFFSGEVPEGANLNHFILAQWGRKRLEEKEKQVAVLLGGVKQKFDNPATNVV